MNRQERIEGIAEAIVRSAMENPATVASIWNDTVNADGAGLAGDEVVAALMGPGTIVRRGIALLNLLEERIESAARQHALQEAESAVSEESRRTHYTTARSDDEDAADLA